MSVPFRLWAFGVHVFGSRAEGSSFKGTAYLLCVYKHAPSSCVMGSIPSLDHFMGNRKNSYW